LLDSAPVGADSLIAPHVEDEELLDAYSQTITSAQNR
jgi:hypothetical protein